jgi:hypothetical protein
LVKKQFTPSPSLQCNHPKKHPEQEQQEAIEELPSLLRRVETAKESFRIPI